MVLSASPFPQSSESASASIALLAILTPDNQRHWAAVCAAVLVAHHVLIAQQVLRQKDGRCNIAVACQFEQIAADRDPSLGLGVVHDLAEPLHFAPPLDRAGTHPKECSNLFIGALHRAQLLQFAEIDLRLRACHSSLLLSEQALLGTPVREPD